MMNEKLTGVNAIYGGIEGEGILIGIPTIFLRLQGCSVRCRWCDSKETWKREEGDFMPPEQLILAVCALREQSGIERVSVTGGSPLENECIELIIKLLKENNFNVNIEISGQYLKAGVLDLVDFISCDYKTPSSGVRQDRALLLRIISGWKQTGLQIKAVLASESDIDDFMSFVRTSYKAFPEFKNFVVTPLRESGESWNLELIETIQRKISLSKLPLRMICQQHRMLWGESRKNC